MKRLIEFMAHQKLFGDLLTFAIIVIGFYSLFTIRREVFHNVSFDTLSVSTVFPGASSAEVERLITNPLEQELKEIDGIKKMTSTSIEGRSLIFLQLDPNSTTEDKAKNEARDIVDGYIPNLPEGAERPILRAHESKQAPLIEVSVSGNLADLELRQIAKKLERQIETIPGVASIKPVGVRDLEVQVEANPRMLAKYQLSLDDLILALKRRNVSVPGGTIEASVHSNFTERLIRTSGQFNKLSEVGDTVIRANELGEPLRLRDVATFSSGLERTSVLSRTNGVSSIRLTVLKKEKADAIDLVDALHDKLDQIKADLDQRVSLTLVNDSSEYVRRRLGILLGNFALGFSLVLLLLPFFLPLRFALIVAIGEPFALLGTIIAFQLGDYALNLISVLGLILVSGILVDDGIVVVENVARLIKSGMTPKEAAVKGAQQMWVPIIASSMTTMMAFVPLAVMSGIFGKFVRYIPLGVIIPICMSLFENFFIMPHHVGAWLRSKDFERSASRNPITIMRGFTERWWDHRVMPNYLNAVKTVCRYRYVAAFCLVVAVALSLLLAVKVMKVVLFPPEGVEIFMIRTESPTGTSLEKTSDLIRPLEAIVKLLPKDELRNFLTNIGIHQQDPHDPTTRRGSEYAQIIVYLTPEKERNRTANEIIQDVRSQVGRRPELKNVTFERINPGPPMGKAISIGVRAENYEVIMPAIEEIKDRLRDIRGVSDVTDNHILGKRQIDVQVDYPEAAAAGLSIGSIGNTVRAAYEGIVATSIRTLEEEVKVRIFLSKLQRESVGALSHLVVSNPQGNLVPLTSVASWGFSQDIAVRQHEANQREVRALGEVDTKVISAAQANALVRKDLQELLKKHPEVTVHFGGEAADTQESLASLAKAFVLAVIGIFLILVLTFRTLLQPLIILITIPLGLIAVVWTFYVHGMPLSFMGMIGMVGLSGIIVNNAIVFVEFVNESRSSGKDRWESILEAASHRARAIFLTTITTIVGIMPTAYGIGGLDKFVVPIAMAMGWGLLVGSLLALFVLPAFISILDDFSQIWKLLLTKAGLKKSEVI